MGGGCPSVVRERALATCGPSAPSALIIASNRGPFEHHRDEDGVLHRHRGAGGVVTALGAALGSLPEALPATWVAAPMTAGDEMVAQAKVAGDEQSFSTLFVSANARARDLHYNLFCNPVLWFVQHGMAGILSSRIDSNVLRHAWHEGYVPLNGAFAQCIASQAARERAPLVMLHDYHLYLAASFVRARLPQATIGHFVHIPWPDTAGWRILPSPIPWAIHAAMCANDVIGMQTPRDVHNFLHGCRDLLCDAQVDLSHQRIEWKGHVTEVRAYPISIDPQSLRERVASREVREHATRLRPQCGEQTIIRVDRLDPTKNVVRGFQSLEVLLAERPDLHGRLRFLAFLVPSRTNIPEYKAYHQQTLAAANTVNSRFGNQHWQPVSIFYEDNYAQALAAMTMYDVLLVNPIIDGMNLVSKEGPTANDRDGVLVLSRTAGSYEQLRHGALPIEPADVVGTASAMARALAMPRLERAHRHELLRQAVDTFDITRWLGTQILDLSIRRSAYRHVYVPRGAVARGAPRPHARARAMESA